MYFLKSVLIAVVVTAFISAVPAFSYSDDVDNIPNGEVFSCDTCHSSGNDFLPDYVGAGYEWTTDLAAMDSDGDGYSNGIELQDPDGSWQEGDPDPGNPGQVTNPGDSSSFPDDPTSTPTSPPAPTSTPDQPTSTPTQPGAPTSTPEPGTSPTPTPETVPTSTPDIPPTPTPEVCLETGVRIDMPLTMYRPGDTCYCDAIVCNLEDMPLDGYPVFVILDVYGSFFFAPSFNDTYDNYLDEYPTVPEGETVIEVLPPFEWPNGTGSASGIRWFGAITNPDVSTLVGSLGTFTFGWSE